MTIGFEVVYEVQIMSYNSIEKIHEIKEVKDDATTIAEYMAIIMRYMQTGWLDRDDAIKKYNDFNNDHPDYYISLRAATISAGTAAKIDEVSADVIVGNLNQQLLYLTGKNLLEEQERTQK